MASSEILMPFIADLKPGYFFLELGNFKTSSGE